MWEWTSTLKLIIKCGIENDARLFQNIFSLSHNTQINLTSNTSLENNKLFAFERVIFYSLKYKLH